MLGLSRRFWLVWGALSGTNLADGVGLVAFPLLAVSLTDDARLVALVTVFSFLPFVLVGLPAGVLLDRTDRRVVAVWAQLARAATIAAVAVAVATDSITIGWLVASSFVMGLGEVLTDGGLPAVVRLLVDPDDLEVANSRISASQTVTNVFVGPPLGALAFEIAPALPFIAAAALFVVPAALLMFLPGRYKPEPDPTQPTEPFLRQMTSGLRYVWGHQVLRPLALTVAAFAFVGAADNAVFVILVTERFGFSNIGFGVVIAVDGVVSVVTSFFVAGLVRRVGHSWSMRSAVISYSVAAFLLTFSTAGALLVISSVLRGVSDPTWNVNSASIRQRLVPDEMFGRMMTAYLVIAWSTRPVGAMLGGVVAEQWGAQWVYVAAGTVVGSLLVFGRPLFRALDEAMGRGVLRSADPVA